MTLTGPNLFEWMALRRIAGGGTSKYAHLWLNFGRRAADYFPFDELITHGLAELSPPEGEPHGMRRAIHTETGRERFHELTAIERLSSCEQTPSPERNRIDTGDDDPPPQITPLPTTI